MVTGENSADLFTRGATQEEILKKSLWCHGPKRLLSEDKGSWPKMDVSLLEMKTTNRNEEEENNATVVTCCFQEMMYREARKGKEPVREERNPLVFQVEHVWCVFRSGCGE